MHRDQIPVSSSLCVLVFPAEMSQVRPQLSAGENYKPYRCASLLLDVRLFSVALRAETTCQKCVHFNFGSDTYMVESLFTVISSCHLEVRSHLLTFIAVRLLLLRSKTCFFVSSLGCLSFSVQNHRCAKFDVTFICRRGKYFSVLTFNLSLRVCLYIPAQLVRKPMAVYLL